MSGSRSRKLRDQLQKSLAKGRFGEVLGHYEALERIEPQEPRWPHRKGDLLKRMSRADEAVSSYVRAVDLYASQGFVARAAAMAKVVLGIDSTRTDVLDRVTADAARDLRAARAKRLSTDALPLVAGRDVGGDVLRSSQPAAALHLDLHISEVEVRDRRAEPRSGGSDELTAQHLAQLPSHPLFAEVPRDVLVRLVRESRLVDLQPGEKLIERGTTADALYTLIEGSVQLIRVPEEGPVVLSEGDIAGISCLLDRVTYEGEVTARTSVRALRISKLLLDRLVAEHPTLGDVLLEMLGRRLVATLVRTSPMFSSFDEGSRSKIAAMFVVRRAEMGTTILQAGKRADGLYIPMIGKLIAVRPSGAEVGSLKLGRALGQQSMLTGSPSPLTVRASSDVLLLRLSSRRFDELVAEHPQVVAHLEELARRAREPTFSIEPELLSDKKGA